MDESKLPTEPTKRQLVEAVFAEYDRAAANIGPQLAGLGVSEADHERMLKVNAAQNTLRTCLEATLNKMVPYDIMLLPELALRLASYALSVAPMERQEELVALLVANFADHHQLRVAQGKVISASWSTPGGSEMINFPED